MLGLVTSRRTGEGALTLGLLLCVISLTGCAPRPLTPEDVEAACRVNKDEFKGTKSYVGATANINLDVFFTAAANAPTDKEFALTVSFRLKQWAFLNSCYAKGGKQLNVRVRDHQVNSGGNYMDLIEELVVFVPRADAEAAAGTPEGLPLKFFGKRGDFEVTVPQAYWKGWLSWLAKQG